MEMKNKTCLKKQLDEHTCSLVWSSSAPAAFIAAAIEDFKAFVAQKIKEIEDQVKADAQNKNEEQKVE